MSLKSLWTAFYQRPVDDSTHRSADHKREAAVLDEIERIVREIDSTILPVSRFQKNDASVRSARHAVLKSPEQHLELKAVSYKLSRLGIRLESSSTEPANEFTVAEFEVGQNLKWVLLWIRVERLSVLSA